MAERKLNSGDIGEIMSIAHALVLREGGRETVLLIEDGRGQELATDNALAVVDTVTVLRWAAIMGKIPNRNEMGKLYSRMQPHDAALMPLEVTGLMDKFSGEKFRYGWVQRPIRNQINNTGLRANGTQGNPELGAILAQR